MSKNLFFFIITIIPILAFGQIDVVPYDHVLTESELIDLLDVNYSPKLKTIQSTYHSGAKEVALEKLANYFKERFSERYFFDWKNFESRFEEYNRLYPEMKENHQKTALSHLERYSVDTKWKMPFKTLLGEDVNPSLVRRLIQQKQTDDIALLYFYTKNKEYKNFLPEHAKSLNKAFDQGLVETIEDGNGAYEAFRGANRMFNWVFAHQCLLASDEYTWQQQIVMLRTFLHTGAQLYHYNEDYREGNHQTRGMSALAMLSFLLPDIKGTDQWKERSLNTLEEHLDKEIYADGFQFERGVHYHILEIQNYFYPYQMGKINNIKLNPVWDSKMEGLFTVLTQIAMPNKKVPALQDETDYPRSEYNLIDETMALGTVLFGKPEFNHFATPKVASIYYWFLKQEQLARLENIKKVRPVIGSYALPETGYYVTRQGWDYNDCYMIISAGHTPQKPDHQHGDMLGVGAYAHGNILLPNYQVQYKRKDLHEFKNSWLKNLVVVDSIPQGRDWIGNKGGTGFGKWGELPVPKVIGWNSNEDFDFFAGSHDGYSDIGVEIYRSVHFIKDGFWIINDQLISKNGWHSTQQVWQGHYDVKLENQFVFSIFPNGAGLDIIQLGDVADNISKASTMGKGRIVFERRFEEQANWITLLIPYERKAKQTAYPTGSLEVADISTFNVKGWQIFSDGKYPSEVKSDAKVIIKKDNKYLFIEASEVEVNKNKISTRNQKTDLWLEFNEKGLSVMNCGIKIADIKSESQTLKVKPGESFNIELN